MAKLSKLQQVALAMMPEIVAGNSSALGYVFKDPFDVAYLIELGYIEQNPEIVNGEELATRATEAGIPFVTPANVAIQAETPKPKGSTKMSFEIENIAVTAGKRGGGTRAAKYPFAELEVGQSFFVAGEKFGASTLTNAMKAYDVPALNDDGTQKTKVITVPKTGEKRTINATKHVRIFTAVAGEKDGVKGFRVGRTA